MAVNIPLTDGLQGAFPLPFVGETFLLTRDKTDLTFRDSSRHAKKLKGRLFMTNLRMVFIIREQDRQKAGGAQTFEIPFRGIYNEKLNQPIFGCINLSAGVMYYDEQPFSGDLSIRIDFSEGGVNTFLPMFNNVLLATRQQLAQLQRTQDYVPPVEVAESTPAPAQYFPDHNEAFVDPQDPSRIYTTQPIVHPEQRRQEPPSWHVSGAGLHRRK